MSFAIFILSLQLLVLKASQPPKMCDRRALCSAIVHDAGVRQLTCSLERACVSPSYLDCLADVSFSMVYGCGGLDCVEVQPFATSLDECSLFYPRVRQTAYVRLVAERRSASSAAAKRAVVEVRARLNTAG
jgi:hypothetical protein